MTVSMSNESEAPSSGSQASEYCCSGCVVVRVAGSAVDPDNVSTYHGSASTGTDVEAADDDGTPLVDG
jgi:hypothetical protein